MFNAFNQPVGAHAVSRRHSQDAVDRRRFLRLAALAGLGVAGVGAVGASAGTAFAGADAEQGPDEVALLAFLLNVQYLVAEFALRGAFGTGLGADLVGGAGRVGRLRAGRKVEFGNPVHRQFIEELGTDARGQVAVLRNALGPATVGRPQLDLDAGFDTVAVSAGLVPRGQHFDVYSSPDTFLLGAFLLVDVSVTAHRGVLSTLVGRGPVDAVGGMLTTVAQHAAVVRTLLLAAGQELPAAALSDVRASLDGRSTLEQGIVVDRGRAKAVLADGNGIAPSRTPGRVLNVLYLSPQAVTSGGFFPLGVNGVINRSDAAP